MALTKLQREFLKVLVSDGEFDILATCNIVGCLPSEVKGWHLDDAFLAARRRYENAQLTLLGYGPLRAVRDTLAIAHSDIRQVQAIDGDLNSLPRDVAVAIKKIEFKHAEDKNGNIYTYPAKVEMHDKAWALKQAAEWFDVGEAPEVKKASETGAEDDSGPRRITGLVVRPPLTKEDRELEDMLK